MSLSAMKVGTQSKCWLGETSHIVMTVVGTERKRQERREHFIETDHPF